MSSRPNRFILNSDYMSMAQAGNHEVDIVLPAGTTVGTTGTTERSVVLPTVKGAVPRYLLSYQTTVYDMESQTTVNRTITVPINGAIKIWSSNGYPTYDVYISRLDANTMQAYAVVTTLNANQHFDSLTFRLRVSYMYPPNA